MGPAAAIIPTARVLSKIRESLLSRQQLALSLTGEDARVRQWLGFADGTDKVVDAVVGVLTAELKHEFPEDSSWEPASVSAKAVVRKLNSRQRLLDFLARPAQTQAWLMSECGGDICRSSLGTPDCTMFDFVFAYSLVSLRLLIVDEAPWVSPEGVAALLAMVAELLDAQRQTDATGAGPSAGAGGGHPQLDPLTELRAILTGTSTAEEIGSYLRAQIRRWDEPIWHRTKRRVAELEQRLKVTGRPEGDLRPGERLSSEEALAGVPMLVVLGGPGSGKTWLARRYARQAAERALAELEAGEPLSAIELPLLTTWDHWVKTSSNDLREGLAKASLTSGVDDLGGGEAITRLRRTLTGPRARVLMIIDSLDEAADNPAQTGQSTRLRDLYSLQRSGTWRVVATSRHGAWQATNRGIADGARVVEIESLTYPADVTSYVTSWFHTEPARAQRLLAEIRERAELRRAAVVPLLLTFYCRLAEDDEPIPPRRRDLYIRLVNRLLSASWLDEAPHRPDHDYCRTLLAGWAWSAVEEAITPSGLGNWPDSFDQPSSPLADQARAIDHVAPRVKWDDEGNTTRRFVHRTVLEHFVAEHLISLSAANAAEFLLPHLWFDPDWEAAAPATIASHRDRNLLIEALMSSAGRLASDPARTAASAEFDRLLLRVAADSYPADWDASRRELLHAARRRRAATEPALVAATSHWTDSNSEVLEGVLAALPTADPFDADFLAETVVNLVESDDQRQQALNELLAALPTVDPSAAARLARTVVALDGSEEQRQQALNELLAALPTANPPDAANLANAVVTLAQTEDQRQHALAGVLEALRTGDPSAAARLAEPVVTLAQTEEQRQQALAGVLAALRTADPSAAPRLAGAVAVLAQSDDQRQQALAGVLAELLTRLPTVRAHDAYFLAESVVTLAQTEEQRQQALAGVLAALPTVDPSAAAGLARTVLPLGGSEEQRAQTLARVLAALPTADPSDAARLARTVLPLGGSEEQRQQALNELLAALPTANPSAAADLADAVVTLAESDGQRQHALAGVLAALIAAHPSAAPRLAQAVVNLAQTEEQRQQALAGVLAALPTVHPHDAAYLAQAVVALDGSADQRRHALAGVLAVLPTVHPHAAARLAEAVVALDGSEKPRQQALTELLAALPTAHPNAAPRLVGAVVALAQTDEQRQQALTELLTALPTAHPNAAPRLVGAVVALAHTDEQRQQARAGLLTALPKVHPAHAARLAPTIRGLSSLGEWIDWLSAPTDTPG